MTQLPESETQASASSTTARGRSLLSTVVMTLGLAWVAYICVREIDQLRTGFSVASPAWLSYSVFAGVVALLLTAFLFRQLLRFHSATPIAYPYAARLLFVGQVLRHLPGRVWGIVYLVNETSDEVAPTAMIRANLELMCYSLGFNLLVAFTLFTAVKLGPLAAVAIALAGCSAAAISLRTNWVGWIVKTALRLTPDRFSRLVSFEQGGNPMPWSGAIAITGLFGLIWSSYLTVWWAFSQTFPALEGVNIWLLCASYSIAWVAGYLSALTPAGLGAREAGFFALASQLTSLSNLTFLAVVIRLWQLGIEVLLFAVFYFVGPGGRAVPGTPQPFEPKAS